MFKKKASIEGWLKSAMIFSSGKLESGLIVVVRFESKNFPDEVELVVS